MTDQRNRTNSALDGNFLLSFSWRMIQNRCRADPSGTSLALPDRLAGDQSDRALHARRRALRALPAPPRTPRHATAGHRWRLVGYRDPRLARWSRPPASPPARLRAARGNRDDAHAGLSRDRPSQPRPDLQRPALAQPRGAVSALPHDPRRSRTSSAPLVERLSPTRDRRPLLGSLQLAPFATMRTRAAIAASQERMPVALGFNVSGGTHDRNPSNPQDDRHGPSPARR